MTDVDWNITNHISRKLTENLLAIYFKNRWENSNVEFVKIKSRHPSVFRGLDPVARRYLFSTSNCADWFGLFTHSK